MSVSILIPHYISRPRGIYHTKQESRLIKKPTRELAESYDTKPWQREISAQITAELRSKLDFIGVDWLKSSGEDEGREVRLLDYACGTGLVSRVSWGFLQRFLQRGVDGLMDVAL